MSVLSILLTVCGLVMAWFTVGPLWLPLFVVSLAAVMAFVQTVSALRADNWQHWSLRALVIALVALLVLPAIERLRPVEIPAYEVVPGPPP